MLYQLLNELPDEFRPKNLDFFMRECDERDILGNDIEWFITWYPELLPVIEHAFDTFGYMCIFEDWDAYLAAGFDYYEDDPYQPLDAIVVEDAGLSGVWYIMVY